MITTDLGSSLGTSLGLGSGIAPSCFIRDLPSQQLPLASCFLCLHQHPMQLLTAPFALLSPSHEGAHKSGQKKQGNQLAEKLQTFGLYRFHLPLAAYSVTQNRTIHVLFYVISRRMTCLKQITISTGVLQSPWLLQCPWAGLFSSLEMHTGCAAEKQSQWVNTQDWYQLWLDQRAQLIH